MTAPYEGMWDFHGACAPGGEMSWGSQVTFTLGLFQWVPRSGGNGLKKGKVQRRIKGTVVAPEEALDRAKATCDALNHNAMLAARVQS